MSKAPLYSKAEALALIDNEYARAEEVRDMVFRVGKQVGMSDFLTGLLSNAAGRAVIEAMPVEPGKLPAAFAVSQTLTVLFQALAEGRGTEAALDFAQVAHPVRLVHSGPDQKPGVLQILEGAA